jgi:hypothetical protein
MSGIAHLISVGHAGDATIKADEKTCAWCHDRRPHPGEEFCSDYCKESRLNSRHLGTIDSSDVPELYVDASKIHGKLVPIEKPRRTIELCTDIYAELAATSDLKRARSMERSLRSSRWVILALVVAVVVLAVSMMGNTP